MNDQKEKTMLSSSERVQLKKMAHHLKPVAHVGKQGVTDGLIKEIGLALLAHELIKIKLPKRSAVLEDYVPKIVEETKSTHVNTIGNIIILYRKIKKPN